MTTAIVVQMISCWFMTGVIWLVQLILYPNFAKLGQKEFAILHQFHQRRITWIVAPIMGFELLSGLYLLLSKPNTFFVLNFSSILLLWLLTALVSIPAHERLSFESQNSQLWLSQSNWPRTFFWSLRSIFWGKFIWEMLETGLAPV